MLMVMLMLLLMLLVMEAFNTGCGACTVMVSRCLRGDGGVEGREGGAGGGEGSVERCNGRLEHYSINSCLAPVVTLHGLAVTTIEVG